MSLEDDLRAALRSDDTSSQVGRGLDARAAIAAARRRRRPRVAIAAGASTLAAAGILAIAIPVAMQPSGLSSTTGGGAPASQQYESSESDAAPAEDAALEPQDLCGTSPRITNSTGPGGAVEAAMTASISQLTPEPGNAIDAVVTVTNASGTRIDATVTMSPVLVADGVIVGTARRDSVSQTPTGQVPMTATGSVDFDLQATFDLCSESSATSTTEVIITVVVSTTTAEPPVSGYAAFTTDPVTVVLDD